MKLLLNFMILTLFCSLHSFADSSKDIAIILKSKGTVKVRSTNPGKWRLAKRGMHLNSGDIIKTGDKSFVAIMFTDDKSLLKVRDNSSLSIKGRREKSSISKRLQFTVGQIWVKVRKQKSDFRVETPSGVAAVKGTEFYSLVDQAGNTTIIGIRGIISLFNKFGEILVRAGETGFISKLTAPTVQKTESSQVPDWAQQEESEKYLEFEFQDGEGNKKTLKINY